MIHEHFGLLIVVFGMVIALLIAIVKLESHDDARDQRLRLDPMNWHPGRFFPPTLNRLNREDERPARVGQEVGNPGRRVGGDQVFGSGADERRRTSLADSSKSFRQIA